MQKPELPASDDATTEDGRRVRGRNNRRKIVEAMLELVGAGVIAPSAQEVATRADVGLRTVFRHFDDMDSLYSEMSAQMTAKILSVGNRPFVSKDWRERLRELAEQRALAYEMMLPFKTAADAFRHKSKFLAVEHAQMVTFNRKRLLQALTGARAGERMLVEALDVLLSFDTWRRLRRDQNLSPAKAKEAVVFALNALCRQP